MSPLSESAKKDLIVRVVAGDVRACVDLIEQGRVSSLERLIAMCFADMNPSSEQFDVLVDGWDLVKEMERIRT